MKTKALKSSVRIMSYYLLEDEEQRQNLINELINPDLDVEKNYCGPFSKELNNNLLKKENPEGIRIVIKHYVHEFQFAELFYEDHKNILFDNNYIGIKSLEYTIPQSSKESNLSDFENYVIKSYYIFNCHFFDIQKCCLLNQINFFDLCRELHFKWDLISTSVTLDYWETENAIQVRNNISKNINNQSSETVQKIQDFKSFPEFLLHGERDKLAEMLQSEFRIEKGKSIALIILVLQNHGILNLGNRQRTNLFNALKSYFNRNIGSKQSIFDYKFNESADKDDYKSFEKRIDYLLEKISNKKETSL
jgi:hypothetical protein